MFTAFSLDNSILSGIVLDEKLPGGTGVVFYKPDGFHDLKAIVNELRINNYFMLSNQAPRLRTIAEQLMDYLHKKYHLK